MGVGGLLLPLYAVLDVFLGVSIYESASLVLVFGLRGVAIAPGASFHTADEGHAPAVRISLGSTSEAELRTGLGIVASLAHGNPEALLLAI